MNEKINASISETFDLEPIQQEDQQENFEIVPETYQENEIDSVLDKISNVVSEDTDFARDNMKSLIDIGNKAIKKLFDVSKESESARSFEVLSNMLKTVGDLNKDLLELQKAKKELSPDEFSRTSNINVDKAIVFTGSTSELVKLIKQARDD